MRTASQERVIAQLVSNVGESSQAAQRRAEEAQKNIAVSQGEGSNDVEIVEPTEKQSKGAEANW